MPIDFEFGPETESAHGWHYELSLFSSGKIHAVDLTLSYADYDHWSRGQIKPVQVAEKVVRYWLKQLEQTTASTNTANPNPWPKQVDCSTLRRQWPGLDQAMAE